MESGSQRLMYNDSTTCASSDNRQIVYGLLVVATARLEVNEFLLAKVVRFLREGQVQHISDIILQHPDQVLVVLWIHCLDVLRQYIYTSC